jgi:foldase protein PrsA
VRWLGAGGLRGLVWGGVVVLSLLVAAAALGLVGCGGGNRDPVIVRIGNSTIKMSALDRRITAIAPEQPAPQPPRYTACVRRQETLTMGAAKAVLKGECERQYQTLRRQALNSLISSRWLIEEASSRSLRVSAREIEGRVRAKWSASPVAGAAREDAAFQARAELCALQLRQVLKEREPKVTRRQVVDYYREHIGRFERQELRYVDLAENFVSASAARRAREKIEAGASLARISLREVLERFNLTGRERQRRSAQETIFAAKPHVLSGPIKLNSTYTIFEVTRVVPPKRKSLARVERSIRRQLEREQQRRTLARFIGAWQAKWLARTDCARGYVVELCRQHRDARKRTVPSTFSGRSAEEAPVELLEKP